MTGFTDGNYSVFADLEIFKAYNREHINKSASLIAHNAIIGKIERINMFASLFHFPGNFPRFMSEYDVDFRDLYRSFTGSELYVQMESWYAKGKSNSCTIQSTNKICIVISAFF